MPSSRHASHVVLPERAFRVATAQQGAAYRPRHAAEPGRVDNSLRALAVVPEPTAADELAGIDSSEPEPQAAPAVVAPVESSSLLPDRDLSLNQPGAAARHHPVAVREGAAVHGLLSRAFGAKTDDQSSRGGAEAELEIAGMLKSLDGRWRVLHAVPVGDRGHETDHVVIGPAGVLLIGIKHHPEAKVWVGGDTFKVNGRNQRYVRTSRQEASRAAKLLSTRAEFDVDVRAIIAVVGAAHGLMVKEQPADGMVTVVTAAMLVKHLESLPNVLGAPSRDRIYAVARHLATWQPKSVGWGEFDPPD